MFRYLHGFNILAYDCSSAAASRRLVATIFHDVSTALFLLRHFFMLPFEMPIRDIEPFAGTHGAMREASFIYELDIFILFLLLSFRLLFCRCFGSVSRQHCLLIPFSFHFVTSSHFRLYAAFPYY